MKGGTKTLLGFLAGLAVGAGVYAFLQSKEGKAWLESMKEKAGDWKEDLEEFATMAKEKAREWQEGKDDTAQTT